MQAAKGQRLQAWEEQIMFEERFLEQALEEIQKLTEENKELKRQVCLYEKYLKDIKELLSEGDNEHCEKTNTINT